jgi:C4-dicarboxylate-specific signal transduction histidine kinase
VEKTDFLNTQGDTLADLAEVLALAGRPAEAAAVLEQAAEVFERKGNLTSLDRARRTARELAASA